MYISSDTAYLQRTAASTLEQVGRVTHTGCMFLMLAYEVSYMCFVEMARCVSCFMLDDFIISYGL